MPEASALAVQRLLEASRRSPESRPALAGLSSAEWAEVLDLADRHGMTPHLHWNLRGTWDGLAAPDDLRETLRRRYVRQGVRNARLLGRLGRVLAALRAAGIDVIVLKGAHLAELVYEEVALRPMVDVDILVRNQDLGRATDVLGSLGYEATEQARGAEHQGAIDENMHVAPMRRRGGPTVEVHYAIAVPARVGGIETEGLWSRAEPASIGDTDALVLSPEDLVLHLCVHVALHHGFAAKLVQLRDLPAVVDRLGGRIDWKVLVERARTWGVLRAVTLTFALAERMFGTFLPEGSLPAVEAGPADGDPVDRAERLLFQDSRTGLGSANLPLLWGSASWPAKVSLVLQRFFPSREEMAFTYRTPSNSARIWLYYPYRAWELFLRHGPTMGSLMGGDVAATATLSVEQERAELIKWMTG